MKTFALLVISLATLAGCSSYNPDLGGAPYKCAATEPRCPDGYTCQEGSPDPNDHVCIEAGGTAPDGGTSGFQCADDSALERQTRNDTIQTAFPTAVANEMQMLSLAGLAICPEGDKDNYAINITTANSNLEVVTSWESGMPVNISILNAGGTSIGNGTAMGNTAMRICIPNLPVGTYYASAFAATTVKNNYKLSIKLVPSC
ncbi:MAG TPA: hypothetical protein VFQ53_14535 [Kofleriaceae bacterium]|nr:hypothetical protein [Kofleriaceae bacterium]